MRTNRSKESLLVDESGKRGSLSFARAGRAKCAKGFEEREQSDKPEAGTSLKATP